MQVAREVSVQFVFWINFTIINLYFINMNSSYPSNGARRNELEFTKLPPLWTEGIP